MNDHPIPINASLLNDRTFPLKFDEFSHFRWQHRQELLVPEKIILKESGTAGIHIRTLCHLAQKTFFWLQRYDLYLTAKVLVKTWQ